MYPVESASGKVRKDKLFVKNIVCVTQAPEVKESQLRELFERYGRVLECTIPRANDPTMSRLYGFVEYGNETDAGTALKATEGKVLYGMPLAVKFSVDMDRRIGQRPMGGSLWQEARARSRSHSPVAKAHYSLSTELKTQRDKLATENKSAAQKNIALSKSIEDMQRKIAKTNTENEGLRKELELMKGVQIFLPCGHPKQVKEGEADQLEKLFQEGLDKLTLEERCNGVVIQKLRTKAVQILEKMHDSFKCRTLVRLQFDSCGHWIETECWIRRNHIEGVKRLKCEVITELMVPCHEVALKY